MNNYLQLLDCLPIKHLPFEEIDAHNVRVGWSTQNSTNIVIFLLLYLAYKIYGISIEVAVFQFLVTQFANSS